MNPVKTKVRTLHRRAFLRGAGGALVGLPFLNLMGCKSSAERRGQATRELDAFPKRLVILFSANGTVRENWIPTGTETDFQLSPILAPLEPYREKLMVLDGIDMQSAQAGPGDAHQKGMAQLLTGTELLTGNLFTGGNGELVGWGGGISVDQRIAQAIGKELKFGSLELGVQVGGANVWTRMAYRGADQPIPPENNPYASFERIFSDVDADPAALAELKAKRRTVLDAVSEDFKRLDSRLGREDRERLERHASSIRDIEARLQRGAGVGEACALPEVGEPIDYNSPSAFPDVARLQMDLASMALACDLTRVVTLQFSNSVSNHIFGNLGHTRGHHDFSHEGDSNADAVARLTEINNWYAEQMAYLCGTLDAIPEGEGTLLDNTVVVWMNELGRGNSHSSRDIPIVMAGSAGGHFRTGRFLQYQDTPHNNLLVSLLRAFGIDEDTFGNPQFCTGPLAELL